MYKVLNFNYYLIYEFIIVSEIRVHCTVYSVRCTMYNIHLYTVQVNCLYTVHTVYGELLQTVVKQEIKLQDQIRTLAVQVVLRAVLSLWTRRGRRRGVNTRR